ncbi:jg4568 [Pararge aegeria aegeria]|uniref:Jg4568 protein n=1 Tax=Pararge aegeria aegeria TaxID=348720 RepID=A0A8S4RNJ2_9NEOP|nr:jg4568 [Pararge aegeria aegeria]
MRSALYASMVYQPRSDADPNGASRFDGEKTDDTPDGSWKANTFKQKDTSQGMEGTLPAIWRPVSIN